MDFYTGPEKESIIRNKRNRTIAWIFFILLIFLLILGGAIVFIDYKIKTPAGDGGERRVISIERGERAIEIAKKLEKEGIIDDDKYFLIYIFIKKAYPYLQAGSYNLSSRLAIPEIVDILTMGKVIPFERQITIPEGWNNDQIDKYLLSRQIIEDKGDFVKGARKKAGYYRYNFLRDLDQGDTLQGFLFPDTYQVFRDATPDEVITKMLDNFERKLSPELQKEIENQGKTILDVINMASIVELEVSKKEDRKIVAGILWKRLENNLLLQADVTVRYATQNWDDPLTQEDLLYNSPYNTRLKKGLPPTPICNPGLEAIEATIYPTETEYWYYLSTPDGETIYSKTYLEHRKAKKQYLDNR